MDKMTLLGLSPEQLKEIALRHGEKAFVGKQIAEWLYVHRVDNFDAMSSLSKRMRGILNENYSVGRMPFKDVVTSKDGTRKYLFPTITGGAIESAYIPDRERATLCVSSQEGCRMGCRFCMTGRGGFRRNLTRAEILNQIFSIEESGKLTNLVFMGMGEPLDNSEEVFAALDAITAKWGMAWSPTRVTLSTIGVTDKLEEFLTRTNVHLAVSLHVPDKEIRKSLMPVEGRHPIDKVIRILRKHDFKHQRRLSFEYTMFGGVNDSLADADSLTDMIEGMGARVNLIRFHKIPDSELSPSSEKRMEEFKSRLEKHGITTTIRASRGEDIFAACGMLSTADREKQKTSPGHSQNRG